MQTSSSFQQQQESSSAAAISAASIEQLQQPAAAPLAAAPAPATVAPAVQAESIQQNVEKEAQGEIYCKTGNPCAGLFCGTICRISVGGGTKYLVLFYDDTMGGQSSVKSSQNF